MLCPNCNRENTDASTFCIYCGAALDAGPSAGEDDSGTHPPLAGLQAEVRELREEVTLIRSTLATYGIRVPARETGRPREESRPTASRQPVTAAAGATPPSGGTAGPAGPRRPMPWERMQVDWELILGGNWMARIGILAVVIGVAFFLKLAFDNDWIGEAGRVMLGIVGGVALLGLSEYLQRRYPIYSQALAGGGVAILYLSIFAAFAFYSLISVYPAVGLLFLISVTAAALSLRHNSVALAVIGILGAFSAPFIIGSFGDISARQAFGGAASYQIMIYVIIVDLGVLALSTFRNWRWFTLLALLGSLASFGLWYEGYQSETTLAFAQGSLTAIFLIFVGATTLFHIIWRRAPQAFDQALMVINAAAYFGISYGLLWDEFRPWIGAFTLLLALFYGGLAYLALLRSREHIYLSFMALGLALVFLTIAVPVQLGGPWVSVAWAVEGAVLVWLSFTLRMPQLRWFGIAVFVIFAGWLLAVETPEALTASVTPFLNKYLIAYLISIGATFLAAYLLRRNRAQLRPEESELFPAFLTAGNLFLTVAVPVQVDGVWIAVAWAIEALALVWLSFRLGMYELRLFGLGVFAILAVRLLIFDTPVDLEGYRLILNYRMLAFASGIAAFYLAALVISREQANPLDRLAILPGLLVAANLLTLWVLSAEVIAAVDSGIIDVTGRAAYYTKSLILSLVWAVYASAGLVLGIVRRWRLVRLASLGLLAIPILKLFLFDSFALEQGYRVAAFLSLGVILLIGGFLYQRYSEVIRGFLFEEQPT